MKWCVKCMYVQLCTMKLTLINQSIKKVGLRRQVQGTELKLKIKSKTSTSNKFYNQYYFYF